MATIGEVQVIGGFVNQTGTATGTQYTVAAGNYVSLTVSIQVTSSSGGSAAAAQILVNGVVTHSVINTTTTTYGGGVGTEVVGVPSAYNVIAGAGATIGFATAGTVATFSWSISGVTFLSANYP